MLIPQSHKRVVIVLAAEDRNALRRVQLARDMAKTLGEVVAYCVVARSEAEFGQYRHNPTLVQMMWSANRGEFDVVLADIKAVTAQSVHFTSMAARLHDLGIQVVDLDRGRRGGHEILLRTLVTERGNRAHVRRVRAGIAAAKARRAAQAATGKEVQTSHCKG